MEPFLEYIERRGTDVIRMGILRFIDHHKAGEVEAGPFRACFHGEEVHHGVRKVVGFVYYQDITLLPFQRGSRLSFAFPFRFSDAVDHPIFKIVEGSHSRGIFHRLIPGGVIRTVAHEGTLLDHGWFHFGGFDVPPFEGPPELPLLPGGLAELGEVADKGGGLGRAGSLSRTEGELADEGELGVEPFHQR